jgi:ribosomal-protein-alanine N-acetyltransferase
MTSIRPGTPDDLKAILAIAAASPEAASWSSDAYRQLLSYQDSGAFRVAELHENVVGFICFRVMSDEAEVLNLAVDHSTRRQGVASRLIEAALSEARQQGARRISLEVRHTNEAAISFYRHHGFVVASERRGYYAHPPADALVLARELPVG